MFWESAIGWQVSDSSDIRNGYMYQHSLNNNSANSTHPDFLADWVNVAHGKNHIYHGVTFQCVDYLPPSSAPTTHNPTSTPSISPTYNDPTNIPSISPTSEIPSISPTSEIPTASPTIST